MLAKEFSHPNDYSQLVGLRVRWPIGNGIIIEITSIKESEQEPYYRVKGKTLGEKSYLVDKYMTPQEIEGLAIYPEEV